MPQSCGHVLRYRLAGIPTPDRPLSYRSSSAIELKGLCLLGLRSPEQGAVVGGTIPLCTIPRTEIDCVGCVC